MMPADASKVLPIWRTCGKVSSTTEMPSRITVPISTRLSTRVWVWIRRAVRLSDTSIGLLRKIAASPAATARTSNQVTQPTIPRCSRCCTAASALPANGVASVAIPRNNSGRINAAGSVITRMMRARR